MSEISVYCGVSDANHFVRLFIKNEGITPGTYKICLNKEQQFQTIALPSYPSSVFQALSYQASG